MENYLVSSEDCRILLAIRNSTTLREAARQLNCDPGGLLRKVQRIADDHGLLQKIDGKWQLTASGFALVGWTQETILSQKKLLQSASLVRIASPSWLAERMLIPRAAALHLALKDSEIQFSIPENGFERALIEGDADFVVACHPPENPALAHKQVCPEKWSAVASRRLGKNLQLSQLEGIPYIRHHGMNPEALLPFSPRKHFLSLDNLVGVRAALVSGLGWSYVPTALVKEEIEAGILREIETGLEMDRKVCLWWLRSSAANRKRSGHLETWLRACGAK